MKIPIICLCFLFVTHSAFAQNDFIGIAKYRISVLGSSNSNTDSMSVIFDKDRVLIILYIPDGNKTTENIFIDDFKQGKSYRVDKEKLTYQVDSLRTGAGYNFKNTNSIGYAVNNELCFRYKADMHDRDRSIETDAECLASMNFRNSFIKNYSFLGVQPIIVDNRIVMDYTVFNSNGTKPNIAISNIRKLENVESYFDMKGLTETK